MFGCTARSSEGGRAAVPDVPDSVAGMLLVLSGIVLMPLLPWIRETTA